MLLRFLTIKTWLPLFNFGFLFILLSWLPDNVSPKFYIHILLGCLAWGVNLVRIEWSIVGCSMYFGGMRPFLITNHILVRNKMVMDQLILSFASTLYVFHIQLLISLLMMLTSTPNWCVSSAANVTIQKQI